MVAKTAANQSEPSMVNGHRMLLTASGGYPPIAMAMDRYEKETTKLITKLVKPGMTVIDVGAHVGYYSLLAASQVGPTGTVYSFEPEPANHELLLKNIELNGYSNIRATRKAVSNHAGSTDLFLTALDSGRHSTYRHGLPERGSIEIETTTIDAFLDSVGAPKIDLVKVDVEGAEKDVLEGMDRLLQQTTGLTLITEFSPTLLQNAAADPLQFLDTLNTRGFTVHCIVGNQGPVELTPEEWPGEIEQLRRSEGSINLLCTKGAEI